MQQELSGHLDLPAPDQSARSWITLQSFYTAETRQSQFLQLLLVLLMIVCIASLGSLSLVQPTVQAATPGASTQGPGGMAITEGACTATPQDMRYLQTPDIQPANATLLSVWAPAGRTQKDIPFAQACAATFVAYYESFDTRYPKTFESGVSMLSKAAKQTFYLGNTDGKMDKHMDPQWRKNLPQVQQNASVGVPSISDSQYDNGKLFVGLEVPYLVVITKKDGTTQIQNAQMHVLLNAIPPDPAMGGTGWNVESWQEQA
ncbi:MAG TPA: hypothetical protein VKR06_08395 [Ktedonosporobacter sp.]|nr:hypothetical protein [Ktedonosporobacter sp.]